jgi:hypothetical protein
MALVHGVSRKNRWKWAGGIVEIDAEYHMHGEQDMELEKIYI